MRNSRADIILGLLELSSAPDDAEGAWLDDAERARLQAMSGPIRPREFLGGRYLARSMAARLLGVRETAIRIGVEEKGRPFVAGPEPLGMGLTHTRDYAACALSTAAVGLDLEELGRKGELRGVEEYAFSPPERASLAGLAGLDRERAFFAVWTLKESYLKRLGLGIPDVGKAPSFALGPGETIAVSGGEPCGFLCFALGDSLIGALAFDPAPGGPTIEFDPRYAPGRELTARRLYGSAELPRMPA